MKAKSVERVDVRGGLYDNSGRHRGSVESRQVLEGWPCLCLMAVKHSKMLSEISGCMSLVGSQMADNDHALHRRSRVWRKRFGPFEARQIGH